MENSIRKEAETLNKAITNYLITGPKSILEFEINCSKLDEKYFSEDIRYSDEFIEMFKKLKNIQDSPCLYVFEIESEISTSILIENFLNFGNQTQKVIPKLKTKIPFDSKTLYVGKVNKLIWGRLITHLGFHTNKNKGNPIRSNNHGLQLYFWAKELNLQIKFKVIEFEKDLIEIVPILEKKLASKLHPIIGKHK